jgi:plasmid stability protein
MPSVLVRDVPGDVVENLKTRAANNRRSLQQELLAILERAAEGNGSFDAAEIAKSIRERLAKHGVPLVDSTSLIRADRER